MGCCCWSAPCRGRPAGKSQRRVVYTRRRGARESFLGGGEFPVVGRIVEVRLVRIPAGLKTFTRTSTFQDVGGVGVSKGLQPTDLGDRAEPIDTSVEALMIRQSKSSVQTSA